MSLAGAVGRFIGRLEMRGLRFPVRHYRAWVEPGVLMRGSRLTVAETEGLLALGIRSIVNLCAENDTDRERQERLQLYRRGLRVEHFDVLDNDVLTHAQIDFFLSWVNDPIDQPCYVHCEAGKGRTGVAVACFRLSRGWTLDAALVEARRYGMTLPEQIACVSAFVSRIGARAS
jgi:protein tyrosine/serine phosphatase